MAANVGIIVGESGYESIKETTWTNACVVCATFCLYF